MASKKLNLKSREALAELSLHHKNAYLQEVAGLIMAVRGEDPVELDKDALARLRRYYSRRSMADLRLNEVGGPLRRTFESLADGIRSDEVVTLLKHELPAPRRSAAFSRPAPIDDAQRCCHVKFLWLERSAARGYSGDTGRNFPCIESFEPMVANCLRGAATGRN
ncbi:hypothetical protein U8Q05_31010 (plasmid) [Rhizobium ruizarguesonis]|nr:hypothetical protein U8Q05_31010 [Rhizobium ruizarguesonis]